MPPLLLAQEPLEIHHQRIPRVDPRLVRVLRTLQVRVRQRQRLEQRCRYLGRVLEADSSPFLRDRRIAEEGSSDGRTDEEVERDEEDEVFDERAAG